MNFTDFYEDFSPPASYDITFLVRQIIILAICVFGFVGNFLTAIVYFSKEMRRLSCSVYLGARAISDNGFMLTVFVTWLDLFNIRLMHVEGICQIMMFLSYVCSFISVWCVVFITGENFIMICKPNKVANLCNSKVTKHVIIFTAMAAVLIYTFPIWGMTIYNIGGTSYCMTRNGDLFSTMQSVLVYSDTLITLVGPMVSITILMIRIIKDQYRSFKRFSERQAERERNMFIDPRRTSYTPLLQAKVTKLLSSVSVFFLLLHTPIHVLRLKIMIENFIFGPHVTSNIDSELQHVFSILYNLNFAGNWVVYFISGKKFRKVFCMRFCRWRALAPSRHESFDLQRRTKH